MQALRLSMTTILCNNSVAPPPFRTTRRPWCPTFQKVIFNRCAVSSLKMADFMDEEGKMGVWSLKSAQNKDEIPLRGSLPPTGDTSSKPSPWPNSTVCCRFLGKIRYLSKKCLSLWQRKALNSRKICDSCPIYNPDDSILFLAAQRYDFWWNMAILRGIAFLAKHYHIWWFFVNICIIIIKYVYCRHKAFRKNEGNLRRPRFSIQCTEFRNSKSLKWLSGHRAHRSLCWARNTG